MQLNYVMQLWWHNNLFGTNNNEKINSVWQRAVKRKSLNAKHSIFSLFASTFFSPNFVLNKLDEDEKSEQQTTTMGRSWAKDSHNDDDDDTHLTGCCHRFFFFSCQIHYEYFDAFSLDIV